MTPPTLLRRASLAALLALPLAATAQSPAAVPVVASTLAIGAAGTVALPDIEVAPAVAPDPEAQARAERAAHRAATRAAREELRRKFGPALRVLN